MVSQHRPGLDGLADGQVKVLFEQPEARIVNMREDNAAGANGDNHQLRADAGGGDQRRGDPARGDGGYGRRTQRDTQHRGDRPRHKQRRHVRFVHDRGDVFIHAAIHQHLLEGAAAADDQQHHGDDFNRRGQGIVDLLHGAAAVQTEGEQGNQYRNQGGHHRVAEELGNWQEGVAFRQDHLSHGAHRHQDHRNQRGPDADAKAGHLFFSEHFPGYAGLPGSAYLSLSGSAQTPVPPG